MIAIAASTSQQAVFRWSFEGDGTIQPAHEMIGKRTMTLVPLRAADVQFGANVFANRVR
jgi:hypothetical protein